MQCLIDKDNPYPDLNPISRIITYFFNMYSNIVRR